MTSKAARRRANKRRLAAVSLPGEPRAEQPARQPDGRIRPVDPRKSALETRLRISGMSDTPEARKAALAPDFGHDAGLCIRAILNGDEAKQAWETFAGLSASYRNYCLLYIGQTGSPQCAAIAMIPEPMETDPSLRVDLRTHDEKVRAAKASWAAWEARIKALPLPQLRWAIEGTLRGFMGDGTLWRDAKPTDTGRTVVAALKAMTLDKPNAPGILA